MCPQSDNSVATRPPDRDSTELSRRADGPAERLLAIARAADDFLERQLERIDLVVARCRETFERETELRRESAELDERRRLWEEQRRAEADRLRAETELLIGAWQAVDTEQRRLLGMRETLAATGGEAWTPPLRPAAPSSHIGNNLGGSGNGGERGCEPGQVTNAGAALGRGASPGRGVEPLSAAIYQRLRREMQRHASGRDSGD